MIETLVRVSRRLLSADSIRQQIYLLLHLYQVQNSCKLYQRDLLSCENICHSSFETVRFSKALVIPQLVFLFPWEILFPSKLSMRVSLGRCSCWKCFHMQILYRRVCSLIKMLAGHFKVGTIWLLRKRIRSSLDSFSFYHMLILLRVLYFCTSFSL